MLLRLNSASVTISEDLRVLLEEKYSCKKVMVIEEGLDDKNSTYRWDLGKIR